jgi:hypothetical protein
MLPVGVVLDVIVDTAGRNLFPFEIVIWLAIGALPVALAYVLRPRSRIPIETPAP